MFIDFNDIDAELVKSAKIVVENVLRAKAGEKALIITNDEKDVFSISMAIYDELKAKNVQTSLIVQNTKTLVDMSDESVSMAIRSECDIIISLSTEKLGKDSYALKDPFILDGKKIYSAFNYYMASKKCRSFWAPGITLDIFKTAIAIDYKRLADECERVKKVLDSAVSVHLTSDAGMDFHIGLKDRLAYVDNGLFCKAGEGGNLPAGETYISPVNESCHGLIVFDGSLALMNGTTIASENVKVYVEKGYVSKIEGGTEAKLLLETIVEGEKSALQFAKDGKLTSDDGAIYKRNSRHIGELGIGLNPSAKIIGNMLLDEKAYNTCHIAIGSNYDDDANSLIHLDCVCKNPTIIATMADGSTTILLEKGLLTV